MKCTRCNKEGGHAPACRFYPMCGTCGAPLVFECATEADLERYGMHRPIVDADAADRDDYESRTGCRVCWVVAMTTVQAREWGCGSTSPHKVDDAHQVFTYRMRAAKRYRDDHAEANACAGPAASTGDVEDTNVAIAQVGAILAGCGYTWQDVPAWNMPRAFQPMRGDLFLTGVGWVPADNVAAHWIDEDGKPQGYVVPADGFIRPPAGKTIVNKKRGFGRFENVTE